MRVSGGKKRPDAPALLGMSDDELRALWRDSDQGERFDILFELALATRKQTKRGAGK